VIDYSGGRFRYIDHGCIETRTVCPRAERLFFIFQSIRSVLDSHKPAESAVETLYFGKNVSSAIPVAEARGVISAALAERGLPVLELRPGEIKQGVTGIVQADKNQVQEMVRLILGLEEIPKPDHAADALVAAICAALGAVEIPAGTGKDPAEARRTAAAIGRAGKKGAGGL
jgi:crossover junction endodeoxyribonuclease RuvC